MMGMAKRAAQISPAASRSWQSGRHQPRAPRRPWLYGRALSRPPTAIARRPSSRRNRRNPLDFDAHLYLGVLLKEDARFDGR
jgi:hypothetical protein